MAKSAIKVKNSVELDRMMAAVANDLVQANCYYKLFRDINDSVEEYSVEFNQSSAFWSLTRDSLFESAVIRLCRVFERDKDDKTASLANLLNTIESHSNLFDFDEFRERLEKQGHPDPVKAYSPLDHAQLEQDMEFVSESNPAVERLIRWRDVRFVHRSSKLVIKQMKFPSASPTYGDYDTLLETGMEIFNRYSRLFKQHTYSTQLVGHDDFLSVLKSIRRDLKAYEEEIKAQFAEHGVENEVGL